MEKHRTMRKSRSHPRSGEHEYRRLILLSMNLSIMEEAGFFLFQNDVMSYGSSGGVYGVTKCCHWGNIMNMAKGHTLGK